GESDKTVLVSQIISGGNIPVYLKIISTGLAFEFYYAEQKDDWKQLCRNVDAGYLSTKNAGGFTGTVIGMYATRNNNNK
ncbi:MAG: glycoside hydrolase family 43 protein, partial [Dysgonamonadaceae bacterium]|nr:glycoside hydrolase family 43 protein [Dysgonamonadaceae bacterium]